MLVFQALLHVVRPQPLFVNVFLKDIERLRDNFCITYQQGVEMKSMVIW